MTDDIEDAASIDCAGTGGNVIAGPLEPRRGFTCVATGTATEGQYTNLGTAAAVGPTTTGVEGEDVPGVEVTNDDWSHYLGGSSTAFISEPPVDEPPTQDPPPLAAQRSLA